MKLNYNVDPSALKRDRGYANLIREFMESDKSIAEVVREEATTKSIVTYQTFATTIKRLKMDCRVFRRKEKIYLEKVGSVK